MCPSLRDDRLNLAVITQNHPTLLEPQEPYVDPKPYSQASELSRTWEYLACFPRVDAALSGTYLARYLGLGNVQFSSSCLYGIS